MLSVSKYYIIVADMTDRESVVNQCGKIALAISKDINEHYTLMLCLSSSLSRSSSLPLSLSLSPSLFFPDTSYIRVIASQKSRVSAARPPVPPGEILFLIFPVCIAARIQTIN